MWAIGIKSGLMTILGLIAYGQIVQLMGLQYSLWSNLGSVVLALGIYSGHYYYKTANNGLMTYRQGLKLGLIVVSFAGLVNALPVYLYTKFMDAFFITQLAESIQKALQQTRIDEATIEKVVQFIQHMTPEFLSIGIFVSTVLPGFACTLVIAAFSKYSKKTTQQP
jgi:Protein of unknown function (DUF4199)